MNIDSTKNLVTLSERRYGVEEVLSSSFVRGRFENRNRPQKKDWDGVQVNMDSLRYATFKRCGVKCCWCGIEGSFFLLQARPDERPGIGHFNLYALDRDKALVLMTKDHVIPKSKGGGDKAKNLVTMCCNCNFLKADRADVVEDDEDWLGMTWFERDLLIPWVCVRQVLLNAGHDRSCELAVRDFLSYYDRYDGREKPKGSLRKWMYENGRILFEMVQFHMKRKARHAEDKEA